MDKVLLDSAEAQVDALLNIIEVRNGALVDLRDRNAKLLTALEAQNNADRAFNNLLPQKHHDGYSEWQNSHIATLTAIREALEEPRGQK